MTGSLLTLRIRHPEGQGVLRDITPSSTIQEFIDHSFASFGLDETKTDNLKILSGFPPKPLNILDKSLTIETLGIRSGDTLIYQIEKKVVASNSLVEQNAPVFGVNPGATKEKSVQAHQNSTQVVDHVSPVETSSQADAANKRLKPDGIKLNRQVVPADNSCLFTAINFCMCGEVVKSEHTQFMREIIAASVSGDEEKYSEPFLGQANNKYFSWIMGKDAWGGAIELQILAEYFQAVIAVVDTKSGCLTRFGESGDFQQTMILIYDGIHYDGLYQQNGPSKKTIFPASDKGVLESARALAEEAKSAHNYTDTAGFTLKCLVCGHKMKGEKEAQEHAQTTKHINFSEV